MSKNKCDKCTWWTQNNENGVTTIEGHPCTSKGYCHLVPQRIMKYSDDFCGEFTEELEGKELTEYEKLEEELYLANEAVRELARQLVESVKLIAELKEKSK